MKRIIIAVACIVCAFAISTTAAEGKKKGKMTEEQKALQKQMLGKYDADKDGKLSKEEKQKLTAEDKKAWSKAFPKKEKQGEATKETK